MPKIEDIDKLKKIVDALGNEQSVRQERGETVEEVQPPEQTLSSDLEDLLGLAGGEGPAAPPVDLASLDTSLPPEDLQLDDISSALGEPGEQVPASEETMGLDVLPEAFGEEAAFGETVPAGDSPDASGLDTFDLPDFGTGTDISDPLVPAAGEGTADAPPAADAGMPDFDLSDFQISETGPEPEEIPGTPSSPAALVGTDDFGFPAEESMAPAAEAVFDRETEELPGEPDAGNAQTGGADIDIGQFDLPDFGDLGGAGATDQPGAGSAASGLEGQMFDLPEGEGAFDREAAAGVSGEPGGAASSGEPEGAFGSFEMPDLSDIESGFGEATEPEVEEPAPPAGRARSTPDPMRPEEFDLPDFGTATGPAAGPGPAARPAPEVQELAGAEDNAEISQGDFERLKATLATLPLNLKIIVEELIGEKELKGPRLKRLLDALVAGDSPRAIAALITSITGQKIVLPKSFEKKTGVAFEREKDSFAYFLRTKGLKAVAIIGAAALVGFILVVGGYQYVIKPLSVMPIYDQGYEAVVHGRFEEGREKFDLARGLWDSRDQYYRFAEAFRDHVAGNYAYADDIYRELLANYPGDVKGTVDYARLKTLKMEFPEAQRLLEGGLLLKDHRHFEGLAAAAENYLAWAEEDYAKLTDADYYYETLVKEHGDRTAARLKRLEYFVRAERIAARRGDAGVDHLKRVTAGVLELRRRKYDLVDPGIFTLIAEYLIDRNEIDAVPELLDKVRTAAPGYAPAAYERARYYRASGEPEKEFPALERAIALITEPEPDTGRGFLLARERRDSAERAAKLALAQNRLAELHLAQGRPEMAEGLLLDAQSLYEGRARDLAATRFAAGGAFGRIYYNLGGIALANNEYDRALEYYRGAETNGFRSPDQTYKKGFIQYRKADYDEALLEFHRAHGDLPENENVLFALATTQYRRRQYQIAEGYYLYAMRLLRAERDTIVDLRPGDHPRHLDVIVNLYVTYNNLGCAYFKQSRFSGDRQMTEALDYLQQAAEIYDIIARYPDTLKRYEETTVVKRRGGETVTRWNEATKTATIQQPVAAPLFNQDIIFHGKAGQVYSDERLDVIIYEPADADLGHTRIISGDRRANR